MVSRVVTNGRMSPGSGPPLRLKSVQAQFEPDTLVFAQDLADVLLEQFEDPERGGFYFTGRDHEQLIHRPKPGHDNATPSGNGVAAYALLAAFNLPVMLIFGMIATIGTVPQAFLPQLFGALLGRYYMTRKFGAQQWYRYTPVLAAGYSCGTGLVGMATVAIALISKTVSPLVY